MAVTEQRASENFKTAPLEIDDGSAADIESDGDIETGNEKNQGMAGMGDIISKILEKPITSTTTILCKSKKSKKRKLELKEELSAKKDKAEEKKEQRERSHIVPSRSNAQKEVLLKKIATKGVVKLFNAVSSHQKTMSDKMKDAKTESKKTKVVETTSKSNFMDLLKQDVKKKKKNKPQEDDCEDDKPAKKWDVIRDDFMMGASMKDWDKTDGDNGNSESSNADESSEEDEHEE